MPEMWNSFRLNSSLNESRVTADPQQGQVLEVIASRRSTPVMALMADSSAGALTVGVGFHSIIFILRRGDSEGLARLRGSTPPDP